MLFYLYVVEMLEVQLVQKFVPVARIDSHDVRRRCVHPCPQTLPVKVVVVEAAPLTGSPRTGRNFGASDAGFMNWNAWLT